MQNTTVLDLINVIKTFATNHKQINTFFSGSWEDFQPMQNYYPSMILFPTTSTVTRGESTITFAIAIADILNDTQYNLDNIYSNTFAIFQDLFSYLNNNSNALSYTIADDGFSCEPFQDQYSDLIAGWIGEIKITIRFSSSKCNLPI